MPVNSFMFEKNMSGKPLVIKLSLVQFPPCSHPLAEIPIPIVNEITSLSTLRRNRDTWSAQIVLIQRPDHFSRLHTH